MLIISSFVNFSFFIQFSFYSIHFLNDIIDVHSNWLNLILHHDILVQTSPAHLNEAWIKCDPGMRLCQLVVVLY